MTSRRKMVIDCDAGTDDAQAILMALKQEDVEVIAITTCHGNAGLQQVAVNVIRILQVAQRTDIPIYLGCDKSLLGSLGDSGGYHGHDALGDVPDATPPDVSILKTKHAVHKLTELVHTFPGEITLVCLAPLTNIAMAIRLDPTFSDNLKDCYIMGGNYEGKGNITSCAEYNFHTDAEAADIVLREMSCPLTLACWELCLKYFLTWDFYHELRSPKTKNAKFLNKIEKHQIEHFPAPNFVACDEVAMAMALRPDMVKEVVRSWACVELHGSYTRGQVIMIKDSPGNSNHKSHIIFVHEIEQAIYHELLRSITR